MRQTLPSLIQHYMDNQSFDELCAKHHIEGMLYFNYEPFRSNVNFKNSWIKNWKKNELHQRVLTSLAQKCSEWGFEPVALKGMALLNTLYSDLGSRFMCDIDLLVPEKYFQKLEQYLTSEGFTKNSAPKWQANNFKSELSKFIDGEEVCIELHSKLYYHVSNSYDSFELVETELAHVKKLGLTDMILHLATHAGFQHTFLNLYWIFDLAFLIEKEMDQIDWDELMNKAIELKVRNSLAMCLRIMVDHFHLPIETKNISSIKISEEFLWSDKRVGFNYYRIKHLVKDSFWEAVKYDINFFLSKTKR